MVPNIEIYLFYLIRDQIPLEIRNHPQVLYKKTDRANRGQLIVGIT